MDSDIESGKYVPGNVKVPRGVIIKNEKQIEGIRKCCKLTSEILDLVVPMAVEGVATRITSYNVCYTKLLRQVFVSFPENYELYYIYIYIRCNCVAHNGFKNPETADDPSQG